MDIKLIINNIITRIRAGQIRIFILSKCKCLCHTIMLTISSFTPPNNNNTTNNSMPISNNIRRCLSNFTSSNSRCFKVDPNSVDNDDIYNNIVNRIEFNYIKSKHKRCPRRNIF